MGVQQLLDAFVERNAGAHREQQDGDDEAPKVEFSRVTEWVARVGRTLRALDTDQQQPLIGRIDQGVDRLRQHCGRAGPRGRRKLGHRNSKIAGECHQHDARRSACRQSRPPHSPIAAPIRSALQHSTQSSASNNPCGPWLESQSCVGTSLSRRKWPIGSCLRVFLQRRMGCMSRSQRGLAQCRRSD